MNYSLKQINSQIIEQYCEETVKRLSDTALNKTYLQSKSYQKKLAEITSLLKECQISDSKILLFTKKYQKKLIPAGTKGTTRGNLFNRLVQEHIVKLKLDPGRFDIEFEKKNEKIPTDEIPDWFIECKKTGKIIIGMNQLDFWSGGQQSNRGFKYVVNNNKNTDTVKFLNVVCNYKQLKNEKSKVYTIFSVGFQKNTLCYINGISNIVNEFFNL